VFLLIVAKTATYKDEAGASCLVGRAGDQPDIGVPGAEAAEHYLRLVGGPVAIWAATSVSRTLPTLVS
jgi:hypothetical protein